MPAIIAMGLVMLFAVILIVTTVYVVFRLATNFPPGKARMSKDLQKLKADISPWFSELVPWDDDEMQRLSLNQINKKISKGIVTTGKGIFTSVYHEPMIAYAFKKYVGKGNHVLLYARTSHHEYAFRIKGAEADVWMDSQPLGRLQHDGTMLGARSNKPIARIKRSEDTRLLPVVVNDKEVAQLISPEVAGKVNPRALELLKPMQQEEEAVFLSMVILEMARKEMN